MFMVIGKRKSYSTVRPYQSYQLKQLLKCYKEEISFIYSIAELKRLCPNSIKKSKEMYEEILIRLD